MALGLPCLGQRTCMWRSGGGEQGQGAGPVRIRWGVLHCDFSSQQRRQEEAAGGWREWLCSLLPVTDTATHDCRQRQLADLHLLPLFWKPVQGDVSAVKKEGKTLLLLLLLLLLLTSSSCSLLLMLSLPNSNYWSLYLSFLIVLYPFVWGLLSFLITHHWCAYCENCFICWWLCMQSNVHCFFLIIVHLKMI